MLFSLSASSSLSHTHAHTERVIVIGFSRVSTALPLNKFSHIALTLTRKTTICSPRRTWFLCESHAKRFVHFERTRTQNAVVTVSQFDKSRDLLKAKWSAATCRAAKKRKRRAQCTANGNAWLGLHCSRSHLVAWHLAHGTCHLLVHDGTRLWHLLGFKRVKLFSPLMIFASTNTQPMSMNTCHLRAEIWTLTWPGHRLTINRQRARHSPNSRQFAGWFYRLIIVFKPKLLILRRFCEQNRISRERQNTHTKRQSNGNVNNRIFAPHLLRAVAFVVALFVVGLVNILLAVYCFQLFSVFSLCICAAHSAHSYCSIPPVEAFLSAISSIMPLLQQKTCERENTLPPTLWILWIVWFLCFFFVYRGFQRDQRNGTWKQSREMHTTR